MNAATRATRRPRALVQVFLAMAVTATGVLAGTQARADEETERGRALAEKLCAVCHLNPGQGDKTGPGTIPGFGAVAKRPDQTLEGIMDWLRSVPPMMPDHHLSQDEMEAIAFYILSLQQQSGS
jgi:mono/diheme cytochrome c family protein